MNILSFAEDIISSMVDSLILMDSNGIILEVNKATLNLLGYKKEEIIGKPVEMLFTEDKKGMLEKVRNKVINEGSITNFELTYKTKAGDMIPVNFSINVVYEPGGVGKDIIGIIGIAKDMRDVKSMQLQLFQAEKMAAIGKLIAGIAHEINNPMTVILGYVQNILKNVKEESELYKSIKIVEESAVRIRSIINELLVFSRSSNLQPELVDINDIVNKTLALLSSKFKLGNIVVVKDLDSNLPMIYVNKNQIEEVFINLYNNSIDAMQNGGTIKVTTRLENGFIKIFVSDTGVGISEENKSRIFEPFFTTKKVGNGTGLGLSICYEIVKKHNGEITFESEINKGTTFIVKFPVGESK